MSPEQQAAEQRRKQRQDRIHNAWQALVLNPHFQTVWTEDLQAKFPPAGPSFRADDQWNPIPAAKRDGNREVVAHIAKALGIAQHLMDGGEPAPTEANVEFQGEAP